MLQFSYNKMNLKISAFCWRKIFVVRSNYNGILFLRVQMTQLTDAYMRHMASVSDR